MNSRVGTVHAENVAVVERLFGDVVYQRAEKPASDFILPFDVDGTARGFVGREHLFVALERFVAANDCGYFEIVAEAGLGKTAVAAEIARRRNAIVFFASASRGTQRTELFLAHVCAELLTRYELDRTTLPAELSSLVLSQFLREAAASAPEREIWIVVDGLDEAEPAPPEANPFQLPTSLPRGVFIVVTHRAGGVYAEPQTTIGRYELRPDNDEQLIDIATFIRARTGDDSRIREALASMDEQPTIDDLVGALTAGSGGNFMYVSFVLADLAEGGTDAVDVTRLPKRLVGYYDHFWLRMTSVRDQDWPTWERLHKPVLARLAVAREAVTSAWLADQVGAPADEVEARVLQPWARVLAHINRDGVPAWRVVHRTFSDYLADTGKISRAEANRAVATVYLASRPDRYDQWDDYAVRNVIAHLVASLDSAADAAPTIAAVAHLQADPRFLFRQLEVVDPARVARDLEEVHALVAESDLPAAAYLLVPIAVALVRLRREFVKPDAIFVAARRGDVARAEHLLDLIADNVGSEWRGTLELAVAWLAAQPAPVEAAALLERARTRLSVEAPSGELPHLAERVAAAITGAAQPPSTLAEPATVPEAQQMVGRLAGDGFAGHHPVDERLRDGPRYLSAVDGPPLVALAAADPDVGRPLFERYVTAHAAYGYWQYRSASLWQLVEPLLEHPDGEWVREMLALLGVSLLAPQRGEFLEGLEIAVLTRQALAGETAAAEALAERRDQALLVATAMPAGVGTAAVEGRNPREGDAWGLHRRRLAALAESARQLALGEAVAAGLLDAAMRIAGGFAGFTAPAYLTLAEAASLLHATDEPIDRTHWFVVYAARAAQNIRDPVLCARMTARVEAMQARWWPAPAPQHLGDLLAALARDAASSQFTALHRIGESFSYRESDDLPRSVLSARTLRELARVYEAPLDRFVAVNDPAWDVDEPLPESTVVNVPDRVFAALLAARLAAAALEAGPTHHAAVRRLVPVAGVDTTALGTTLSRLLLTAPLDGGAERQALDELGANPLIYAQIASA